MTHVLEGYYDIVLSGHVVSQVMIDNQSEELIQECKIDLVIEFLELGLHQYDTLVFRDIPDISEIVDALTPFVNEKWRRLRIPRLDPVREEVSLISLIPQVLIKVRISDLLNGLDIIYRDQVRVQVHELDAHLFEGSMA